MEAFKSCGACLFSHVVSSGAGGKHWKPLAAEAAHLPNAVDVVDWTAVLWKYSTERSISRTGKRLDTWSGSGSRMPSRCTITQRRKALQRTRWRLRSVEIRGPRTKYMLTLDRWSEYCGRSHQAWSGQDLHVRNVR